MKYNYITMINFTNSQQRAGWLLLTFLLMVTMARAQFNPTEAARGFNVLTSGAFQVTSGDVEGGVAVGGKLTINGNVQVNMHGSGTETFKDEAAGDSQYIGLIVQDGVAYTAGKVDVHNNRYVKIKDLKDSKRYLENNVYQGIIVASNANNKNVHIQGNGNQSENSLKRDVSDVFNFNTIISQFQTYSDALKNAPANASFENYEGNKYRFKLTANQTNIVHVTASQLNSYGGSGEFQWTTVPSAATPLVVNVDMQGQDFTWNSPNMMLGGVTNGTGEFVLWNFYNGSGKKLYLRGGRYIIGSVLALGVSVDKKEGYIEGQVIAKDFYMEGGEIHYKRFKTTVTPPPPPTECTGCVSKNLVYNPNFEVNPNSPDGWNPEVPNGVDWGTFYHDGVMKYVGYLNWNDAWSNSYVRQNITNGIVGGKQFTYTARASSHYSNRTGARAQLWLEFYNAAGTLLQTSAKQNVTSVYSNFQTITITGTFPANTAKVVIVGHSYGNALKFDNNLLTISCYDEVLASSTKVDANCSDAGGKITVTASGGSGQYNYYLKKGTGAWGSAQSSNVFSNLTSGTYTVRVEDKNIDKVECKKEFTVVINKDPIPVKPSNISDKTLCFGGSVTLPGTCSTGTLKWYQNDQTTLISGNTVSPTITTTYKARCESSCNSEWVAMKVTVNPKPTVSVDSKTICVGESATLTATCTTGTVTWE
jgi:choice-of-anchor A domain-containing protein